MKLDTAAWFLVLYFSTKLGICRSKGISNENDGLCDIKIWYLDMMTEGAFEGQLTKEQQKIKTSVRKLMSKKKGSMKMDCDILNMYAETLLSGKSEDDENEEVELDDNKDDKTDENKKGIGEVEKRIEDGVEKKTESTDNSDKDVKIDSKDSTPKDELLEGNNATHNPLVQKHQTLPNISSGTMAFIIHCLQTIPVDLTVSRSTQGMYVWGDSRFISTDCLKDKHSLIVSQHAKNVRGVCQHTYHVLCEVKSMFRQISFSWQKSQKSLELLLPKRNIENCDTCGTVSKTDRYTQRICYYKYLLLGYIGKTHEEHLPPIQSVDQQKKSSLCICKSAYHRFCEVESVSRQLCFPWHKTKFIPQQLVPKSAVYDCFMCRSKNVRGTPRICYFKYIILEKMPSPVKDENKSLVDKELPMNSYLNKCKSCSKMCSKYCRYLYYLWTMSPVAAKGCVSIMGEPNKENVTQSMNKTTASDAKAEDKGLTDNTEEDTNKGTADKDDTPDVQKEDKNAHTDVKTTNDIDNEESNSNKNKPNSMENKNSSVSGDENTILSHDSKKRKDQSDSESQSIKQKLKTLDSGKSDKYDKDGKTQEDDDPKNDITGQAKENSQESTQTEKDSKSTDTSSEKGSLPLTANGETASGKERENVALSGKEHGENKEERNEENKVSEETKGENDRTTEKTDSESASNKEFPNDKADRSDPSNLPCDKKDGTSGSIESHPTIENTHESSKEIKETEKDGGSPGRALDQQTKEELEAKHMELKQYLEQKRQEYSDKIQNLEVHLLKLENKLLVDTLNKNNNSATFTKLENHILKIENELLRINHSFALLKAEGDKLRHYQMSTANELELVRKRENKYPALPGNDTFLDIIQTQRGEISHLSDIIGKQTKAIQNLQSNLKQMKTQNGLLKDIMKEQSELTEELKTKMSEMEKEQEMQREQLKQAMVYLQKYQGADNQPETPDTPDVSSTVRKSDNDVDEITNPEKVDEEQPKGQKRSTPPIDNGLKDADKQLDEEDSDVQSDDKDEASDNVNDEIGLKDSVDEDENISDEMKAGDDEENREDSAEDIDNANQEEESSDESGEEGILDENTQGGNVEEEKEEGTGGAEEEEQKGDDELEDAYDYKSRNQDEEENLEVVETQEKDGETVDDYDKDAKDEEQIEDGDAEQEQEIQDDESAQHNDEQVEDDANDQVMETIRAAEEDNEDVPAAEDEEAQDQQTKDAGNLDDKTDDNDESDEDKKPNNDDQDPEIIDNVDEQDQEIKVTEEAHDKPIKGKKEVKDSGKKPKKIAKKTDKGKGDSNKSIKMRKEGPDKEPDGNTGVVKKAKENKNSKKLGKQEKPSKQATEKAKGQDIKETADKSRKDLKSNKQKTDKSKSSKTVKKTTADTKDSEVGNDKKISSKKSVKGKGDKIKSSDIVSKSSNKAKKDVPVNDKENQEPSTGQKAKASIKSKTDKETVAKTETKKETATKKQEDKVKQAGTEKNKSKKAKETATKTETIKESGNKKQDGGVKKDGIKKSKTVEEEEPKVVQDTQTDKGKKKKKKKGKKAADTPPTPVFAHIQQDEPKDCYDHYMSGRKRDTSLSIRLAGLDRKIEVYCDMKKGGWTVIQRRMSGSLNFFREWSEYKKGFGDIWGDHWLGNDNIHALTNQGQYSLRIDMMDWDRKKVYAQYDLFLVEGEEQGYKLHVAGYEGDAGDGLLKHNKMKFSTKDVDNDLAVKDFNGNCAERFTGAWWYYKCYKSNLNGKYYRGGTVAEKKFDGVAWKAWKGSNYSLKYVEMKVRPYVPK